MNFTIKQHERNDSVRGMQYDSATYVEGYNRAYGTSRAKIITLDGIEFCVSLATRDCGVWWIRDGEVRRAPRDWAALARSLANGNLRRDDATSHLFTATGAQLLAHFVDSHDAQGKQVPGGRASGLHFPMIAPLRAGSPDWPTLGTRFHTGTLAGKPVVSQL